MDEAKTTRPGVSTIPQTATMPVKAKAVNSSGSLNMLSPYRLRDGVARGPHCCQNIVLGRTREGMAQISLSRKMAPVKQYLSMVRKAIEEPKYPTPESHPYGLIGNITFGFDILGNGEFRSIRIMESSGDELLDRTAVEAIEKGSGKNQAATGNWPPDYQDLGGDQHGSVGANRRLFTRRAAADAATATPEVYILPRKDFVSVAPGNRVTGCRKVNAPLVVSAQWRRPWIPRIAY